jgi:hypothetical protein
MVSTVCDSPAPEKAGGNERAPRMSRPDNFEQTEQLRLMQAAVAAGRQVIAEAGVLVSATVISRPHPDVYREVI